MRETELFDLLEGTGEAAFVVDEAGIVRFWNPGASRLLGLPAGKALNRECASIVCGLDSDGSRVCVPDCSILQLAQNSTHIAPYDLEVSTAAGERKWVNVSVLVARTSPGNRRLLVHLLHDIDARKRLETITREILTHVGRLTGQQADELLAATSAPVPKAELTAQEQRVLSCLALGQSTNAIGAALSISPATVRNHIQRILGKLRVHTRFEAVMRARRERLI